MVVAHELMRHAHTAILRIATISVHGGSMQIYLANTQADPKDAALRTTRLGRRNRLTENGWISLRSPRIRSGLAEPLHQVLDHEIVHILLGRALHTTLSPMVARRSHKLLLVYPNKVDQLGIFAEPMSFGTRQRISADALRARMAYASRLVWLLTYSKHTVLKACKS